MCEKTMIRNLNDALRADLSDASLGLVVVTSGVRSLGHEAVQAILRQVGDFDQFEEANDPYQEHDFGAFEYGADSIFWKIDYYDIDFRCGSENPASAADTKRVLTVMLASEY
jgi:Protein of unknown function (DUF3768)